MSTNEPNLDEIRPSSGPRSQGDYASDEFDTLAQDAPAGAHRRPVKRWQAFLPIIVILILGPLLAWGAVAFIQSGHSSSSSPAKKAAATQSTEVNANKNTDNSASANPTAEGPETESATVDKQYAEVEIMVFNTSSKQGLAQDKVDVLKKAGFTKLQAANSSGRGITGNTVVYKQEKDRQAAQAVAEKLGITNIISGAKFRPGALTTPVTVYAAE